MKKILSASEQERLFSCGEFEKLERNLWNEAGNRQYRTEEECIQASCIARYYYLNRKTKLSKMFLPELEDSIKFSDICQFYVYFTHAQRYYEIDHQLDKSLELYVKTKELGERCIGASISIVQMMIAVYWRLGTIYAYKGQMTLSEYYFNCSLECVKDEKSDMAYAIYSLSQVWLNYAKGEYIKSLDVIFDVFFNRGDLCKMEYLKTEYLFAMVLNEIQLNENLQYIRLTNTLKIIQRNLFDYGRGYIYTPFTGEIDPVKYIDRISSEQGRVFTPSKGYSDVKHILQHCNIKAKCEICGCDEVDELTVDHVIPQSYGGNDNLINLRILCRKCNSSKGNKFMIYDPHAYKHLKKGGYIWEE